MRRDGWRQACHFQRVFARCLERATSTDSRAVLGQLSGHGDVYRRYSGAGDDRSFDGFRLRAEAVARAITPRTKLLIVNSPSNPSGAVVPADEFARIYEVCRAKSIWLLTDECYSHFVYGNEKPFSLASLPGTKPNIIVAGSLSKTFAMTGWRVGYALAPPS